MVKLNGRFIIGKSITRSSRNELYKSNAFMAAQASQGTTSFDIARQLKNGEKFHQIGYYILNEK